MRAISAAILLFSAPASVACTVCDTEAGATVRAGIFNGSFLLTFVEVIAVFPVLGLVLYFVNRWLPD